MRPFSRAFSTWDATSAGELTGSWLTSTMISPGRTVVSPSSSTSTDVLPQMADTGEPVINGIENALLAFVEGDTLEHMRQYGKAQIKFQEASGQLTVARDLDNHQAARVSSIVPHISGHWEAGDFE